MKIRPRKHTLAFVLLSSATIAGAIGCSAVKKISPSQTSETTEGEKKYQWIDESTGRNFYGRPRPNPTDRVTAPTNVAPTSN